MASGSSSSNFPSSQVQAQATEKLGCPCESITESGNIAGNISTNISHLLNTGSNITPDSDQSQRAIELLKTLQYLSSRGINLSLLFQILCEKIEVTNVYPAATTSHPGKQEMTEEELKAAIMLLEKNSLVKLEASNSYSDDIKVSLTCFSCVSKYLEKVDRDPPFPHQNLVELSGRIRRLIEKTRCQYCLPLILNSHLISVHAALKQRNWPSSSIKDSLFFLVALSSHLDDQKKEIFQDISAYFQNYTRTDSGDEEDEKKWEGEKVALEIIKFSLRAPFSSSSTSEEDQDEEKAREKRKNRSNHGNTKKRRHFGVWILSKIRENPDCSILVRAGCKTLDDLTFCCRLTRPSEEILEWAENYVGEGQEQIHRFCAVAIETSTIVSKKMGDRDRERCIRFIQIFMENFTKNLIILRETDALSLNKSWSLLEDLLKYRTSEQIKSIMATPEVGFKFLEASSEWCEGTWKMKFEDKPKWVWERLYDMTRIMLWNPQLLIDGREVSENEQTLLDSIEFPRFCVSLLVNPKICVQPKKFDTSSWMVNFGHIFRRIYEGKNDSRRFFTRILNFGLMEKIVQVVQEIKAVVADETEQLDSIFYLLLILVHTCDQLSPDDVVSISKLNPAFERLTVELEELLKKSENLSYHIKKYQGGRCEFGSLKPLLAKFHEKFSAFPLTSETVHLKRATDLISKILNHIETLQ